MDINFVVCRTRGTTRFTHWNVGGTEPYELGKQPRRKKERELGFIWNILRGRFGVLFQVSTTTHKRES